VRTGVRTSPCIKISPPRAEPPTPNSALISLANALDWSLKLSEEEKKKIANAAKKNAKDNFTKQIMCDKTIAVYRELVTKK
jgi:glycosyltransferase involved in cell wall biosynthesis